jgi:hypothetical protein
MHMSNFRHWVQELWMQHKDEYVDLKLPIPEVSMDEYFQKYKYWLKREYRYQTKKSQAHGPQ